MTVRKIAITPIDEISDYILEHISLTLEHTFRSSPYILLPGEKISSRIPGILCEGKYNSTALLLYLSGKVPENTLKLLSVTQSDLYSPIFSHLYGEAQLGGACALMSLYRLRPEFYNLPPDREVFISRCEKEAIHEIGHTFGLVHCMDRNCIMYPSSTINDTDVKSNSFCPRCAGLLRL